MSDEIDRERLIKAAIKVLVSNPRLPEWMRVSALGQNMRPLAELVVDAVLPLVQRARHDGAQVAAKVIETNHLVVARAVSVVLDELEMVAHKPVQGEAMHKVIGYEAAQSAASLAREAVSLPVGDGVTDDTVAIQEAMRRDRFHHVEQSPP